MEGRRITANIVRRLQRREISSKRDRAFSISNAQERFRNMCLQEEYDTHDPSRPCSTELSFLKERTEIVKLVAACGIVFALAGSGMCAAFCRETNQRTCFLNNSPDEAIDNLFYHKRNESVIIVSLNSSDKFSSLNCRTTWMECIKRGKPDAGFPLFGSESFGYVGFDDVNGKVFTFSKCDSVYKIFDLKNYTMLYSISDKNVQWIEMRSQLEKLIWVQRHLDLNCSLLESLYIVWWEVGGCSPTGCQGFILIIFTEDSGHLSLKILSIEDGTVLKSFDQLLHPNKKLDFIKQFNEKLLVKQENENLKIVDVCSSEFTEANRTHFITSLDLILLYEKQLFLTFRNRTFSTWNIRWELFTSFEDHLLWHPASNSIIIYITSDEATIVSYCKAVGTLSEANVESIIISNILTGKCLAKIKASNNNHDDDDCDCSRNCDGKICNSKQRLQASSIRSTVAKALEDITVLVYDEEHNEIYTRNRSGLVHVLVQLIHSPWSKILELYHRNLSSVLSLAWKFEWALSGFY